MFGFRKKTAANLNGSLRPVPAQPKPGCCVRAPAKQARPVIPVRQPSFPARTRFGGGGR